MFQVGDKISYPMHGAGRVEGIEEKEVLGNVGMYYVIYFYCDGMKVMIPVDRAEAAGLRPVIREEEVQNVFDYLSDELESEALSNWNRRYRFNLEKLREGNIYSIAEVAKALSARHNERGLSAGEKKMLASARRYLLGELYLAGGGSEEELSSRLDACLGGL